MSKKTQTTEQQAASPDAACASCPDPGAARKKKRVRAILAVLLALVVAAVGFTAGWLGKFYSVDPRLRELEWILGLLEDEHYQADESDAYRSADKDGIASVGDLQGTPETALEEFGENVGEDESAS